MNESKRTDKMKKGTKEKFNESTECQGSSVKKKRARFKTKFPVKAPETGQS